MARVGGRNAAMSWVAGVVCVGVIGALLWFAAPVVPMIADMIGQTLRVAVP